MLFQNAHKSTQVSHETQNMIFTRVPLHHVRFARIYKNKWNEANVIESLPFDIVQNRMIFRHTAASSLPTNQNTLWVI